jgi:hypothetical protein
MSVMPPELRQFRLDHVEHYSCDIVTPKSFPPFTRLGWKPAQLLLLAPARVH